MNTCDLENIFIIDESAECDKENCPAYSYCTHCYFKDALKAVCLEAPESAKQTYKDIIEALKDGKNIFLTASAGCGKSFLLEKIKNSIHSLVVTASTGIAALNIGGGTLHSTLGIGLGNKPIPELMRGLNKYKQKKLEEISFLAIDEVSMISGALLDYCNEFLKMVRRNAKPFGGIQVILIGDFCQLPPVQQNNQSYDYCFKSKTWKELDLSYFRLKHNFRQAKDTEYSDILENLREGKITECSFNRVKSKEVENKPVDVPFLYATNKEVNQCNMTSLYNLGQTLITLKATYEALNNNIAKNHNAFIALCDSMKKNSIIEDELTLCLGARVMLCCNKDIKAGLVNGSLGYIEDFIYSETDKKELEKILVKFDNDETRFIEKETRCMYDSEGKELISMTQFPLKVAYALTVHKSQGATLEKVYIDFNHFFEINQAYVALSRVKTLDGLYLKNFDLKSIRFSPEVLDFYKTF